MHWNPDQSIVTVTHTEMPFNSRIRIKDEDLARWLEQLATLLEAGVPLPQALQGMESGMTGKSWQPLLARLQDDLSMGTAFSETLEAFPRTFDPFAIALIRTGERTGQFDVALRRLSNAIESRLKMKRQLLQLLSYPAVVLTVSIGISLFLLISVMPQFAQLFADHAADLPWLTARLLDASDVLTRNGVSLLLGAALIVLVTYRFMRSKQRWRSVLSRLPMLGALWLQMATSRWASTLSLSTRVGLPFLEGIHLAAQNAGHPTYLRLSGSWAERIRTGDPLVVALHDSPLPKWALQMIAVGQETGTLDVMLERIGTILEDDTARRVQRMQTVLEPLVMLVIGAVVGTLLLAMYLPIFRLASAMG